MSFKGFVGYLLMWSTVIAAALAGIIFCTPITTLKLSPYSVAWLMIWYAVICFTGSAVIIRSDRK